MPPLPRIHITQPVAQGAINRLKAVADVRDPDVAYNQLYYNYIVGWREETAPGSNVYGLVLGGYRAPAWLDATPPSGMTEPLALSTERLRERMQQDDTVVLSAPALKPGQSVRITQGPFAGVQAIFASESGAERVRLLLAVLGERVSTVVPRSHLAVELRF